MATTEMNCLASGGGGKVPFTVTSGRTGVTVDSQDLYLYNDGGVAKMHFELTVTISNIGSGNSLVDGFFPFNLSNIPVKSVLSEGFYLQPWSNGATISLYREYNANGTYTFNQDITIS